MAPSCILYYIISALLGALLSWLLFGGKNADLDHLTASANRDKEALRSAITELNTFKNNAKAQLSSKDTEISKLKKSSALPDIITKAQDKEIKHWKEKAATLEQELEISKSNTGNKSSDKVHKQLTQELTSAKQAITQKNNKIEELRKLSIKKTDTPTVTSDYKKLKKKLKKLKKKLKAQNQALGQIQTIEIRETIDLDKLSKLLAQGKLTSKTKKVSKKKIKKTAK